MISTFERGPLLVAALPPLDPPVPCANALVTSDANTVDNRNATERILAGEGDILFETSGKRNTAGAF